MSESDENITDENETDETESDHNYQTPLLIS